MVNLCEALEEEEAAMGSESRGDQECGVEREREREREREKAEFVLLMWQFRGP